MHARIFVLPCLAAAAAAAAAACGHVVLVISMVDSWASSCESAESLCCLCFSLILIPTIVFIITSSFRVVPCWLCGGCRE